MLLQIPAILSAEQVAQCRHLLDRADWHDGKLTAGPQSARVKQNEQLPDQDETARELSLMVTRALERSPDFIAAALPHHVFPPLFNRYAPGMRFGAHVDNAIRQVPGTPHRMRTDLSATLFLSRPDEYDGGELVIEDIYGTHAVKLAAGDLVLYPATSLHRVEPVTRGARIASFFWIQSMVRDEGERSLLFDLDLGIREIVHADPDAPVAVRLTACYHNLLRRWAELLTRHAIAPATKQRRRLRPTRCDAARPHVAPGARDAVGRRCRPCRPLGAAPGRTRADGGADAARPDAARRRRGGEGPGIGPRLVPHGGPGA